MLPVGDEYAEQQFLGGFIALRFLKDPARALTYFQQSGAPMSRARSANRAPNIGRAAPMRRWATLPAPMSITGSPPPIPKPFTASWPWRAPRAAPLLHLNDSAVEAAPQGGDRKRSLDAGDQGAGRSGPGRRSAAVRRPGSAGLFLRRAISSTSAEPDRLGLSAKSRCGWPRSASYAGVAMLALGLSHPAPARLTPAPARRPSRRWCWRLIRQETEFDPYAVSQRGRARPDADDAGLGARRRPRMAACPTGPPRC